MNVLSAVLPGLRDVRTPLAVGLTWLAAAWVAFNDLVPTRERAQGLPESVYRLSDIIGSGATLAVLTFSAYLLGILVNANVMRDLPLGWLLRRGVGRGRRWLSKPFNLLDDGQANNLRRQVELMYHQAPDPDSFLNRIMEYEGRESRGDSAGEISSLLDSAAVEIVRERDSLANRLSISKPEIYAQYDAQVSESQFRQSMAFPLIGLTLAAAVAVSGVWTWVTLAMGLSLSFFLWIQGVRRGQAARSRLIGLALDHHIESDTLQTLTTLSTQGY
jgi:hypothetical protein